MTPFAWSFSRHRSFESCRRRYGFEYYGSRQGWRRPPGERARLLYELKRLVTPPQWAGQLAHDVAATAIGHRRRGLAVDDDALIADVLREARAAIDAARHGLSTVDPRAHVGFEVLAYGDDPGDAAWEDVVAEIESACRGVLTHPLMARIAEVPARIVEVERHVRSTVDDFPITVALDVLVSDGRGGLVVIDWKTGRHQDPDEIDAQLATYALSVVARYRVSVQRVLGLHASTRDGSFRRVAFDADALEAAKARVRRTATEMAALLPDPKRDRIDIDALAPLPPGDPACGRCRFRRACDR